MALFNPCMKFYFFGPNVFIWSANKVPFRDFIQNMSQALSMCLSKWINVIISKIPHPIFCFCFCFCIGTYESLKRLEGKTGEVQSCKITVFAQWSWVGVITISTFIVYIDMEVCVSRKHIMHPTHGISKTFGQEGSKIGNTFVIEGIVSYIWNKSNVWSA